MKRVGKFWKVLEMLFEDRQKRIIELLERQGSVKVSSLAEYLGVSKVTVRRHLDILSRQIPIVRVRGGALSNKEGTSYEPNYNKKSGKYLEIKQKIGSLAASLVSSGETILIDAGSTTWHVASSLIGKSNLTIITNDLKIALLLANSSDIGVYLAGGKIRPYLFSSLGHSAEEYIKNFNASKLFLGADSVDIKKGITNASAAESYLKKEMIRSSKEVILVTDSSKFNKVSFAQVSDFSVIDHIISDKKMPEKYKSFFKKKKIKLSLV